MDKGDTFPAILAILSTCFLLMILINGILGYFFGYDPTHGTTIFVIICGFLSFVFAWFAVFSGFLRKKKA
jgi:hypothetical protein